MSEQFPPLLDFYGAADSGGPGMRLIGIDAEELPAIPPLRPVRSDEAVTILSRPPGSTSWHGYGVQAADRPLTVGKMDSLIYRFVVDHGGIAPEYWILDRDEAAELADSLAGFGGMRGPDGQVVASTAIEILAGFERGSGRIAGIPIRVDVTPLVAATDDALRAAGRLIAKLEAENALLRANPWLRYPRLSSTWEHLSCITIGATLPAVDEKAIDHAGPRDTIHDRAYEVAKDLVNGRITKPSRDMIRKALDKADALATGRQASDGALGRALRLGAAPIGLRVP